MLKKLFLALPITLLLFSQVNAITWGEPDDNEHPNVGTLLFVQNGVGFFSCTGTMISTRVMLTAAHCVSGAGQTNDVTYVRFEDNALSGIGDYASLQDWFNAEWIVAETVIAHPNWTDYGEFPMTYDIGVVILSQPYVPSNGFATLPPEGFLENLRGRDKQKFEVVGFGRQGTLPPTEMNDYEKYKGNVRLLEVNSFLSGQGDASAKFSNNPGVSGGGGTCYGDSGGPTFYKDSNLLVAVTSFGWAKNGNCVGNDFNYRTDIPDAIDFIESVMSQYGN